MWKKLTHMYSRVHVYSPTDYFFGLKSSFAQQGLRCVPYPSLYDILILPAMTNIDTPAILVPGTLPNQSGVRNVQHRSLSRKAVTTPRLLFLGIMMRHDIPSLRYTRDLYLSPLPPEVAMRTR